MDKLVIGCGYIGGRVAVLWRAAGHRVFATTRKAEQSEALRRQGLEPIICDVTDPASLAGLPTAASVFYGIGLDRSAGQSMRQVYVEGLRNVLEVIRSPAGSRLNGRFIYISSTSVYGQADGEEVDESSPTEPQEESGRICLEAERLLHATLPQAIILRFAGIYGPGRLLRRQAIEKGEPIPADPERWLNLVHGDDGAAAVLAAEERGKAGAIYNVSDGTPVRRREFFEELAKQLGAKPPRFVEPPPGTPHERGNRRVNNRRLREELGAPLRYLDYRDGIRTALG